jgi:hypothetical protein
MDQDEAKLSETDSNIARAMARRMEDRISKIRRAKIKVFTA